jgi:hypothetical protein
MQYQSVYIIFHWNDLTLIILNLTLCSYQKLIYQVKMPSTLIKKITFVKLGDLIGLLLF